MKAADRRPLLQSQSMSSSTQSLESQEVEAIVTGTLNTSSALSAVTNGSASLPVSSNTSVLDIYAAAVEIMTWRDRVWF